MSNYSDEELAQIKPVMENQRYDISVFGVVIGTADGDNSLDGETEVRFENFQHSDLFDPHIPNCDYLGIDFQSGEITCYGFPEGSPPVQILIDTQFFLQMLSVAAGNK